MLKFILLMSLLRSSLALYSTSSAVIDLTPPSFNRLVLNSDEVWMVKFFVPWCGYCQTLVAEYEKVANALKGIIKVGAVNVDKYKELGEKYSIDGFPIIKIFRTNKDKPEIYEGVRTAQGMVDAVLSALRTRAYEVLGEKSSKKTYTQNVIELTDKNFDRLVLDSEDMWLVEFFAPWCGHCKNLAPHWTEAAKQLRGKVKLGVLDATVHTAKANQYGIKGFPTIKYFGPGKKHFPGSEYDGGRSSNDIVNWALEKLARNSPAPETVQIIDEKSFKNECTEKALCVISVLPHILECQTDCRYVYLNVLKEISEIYKEKMWGWVWVEAGAQIELEHYLEIGGFGYPALAVLSPKKMKYSLFKGSYSKDSISEFLRNLSYGRGSSATVKSVGLPKIVKGEAWNGKDGELLQNEDIELFNVLQEEKIEL